ncbi:Cardiolipin synthase (CMP-forming) [Pseudozyma hubeiensis]|nr:Cardiolipin synthase (CMP-forming) [Pseudozyma hubeiensis]
MVLNVGLMWSAPAVRGVATGKTATAIPFFFQTPLTRRCLSTASQPMHNQPAPTPTPKPSPAPTQAPPSKPALSEDILTLPNLLTISRLLATPYIGYLVATHQFVPACTLLFVASLTDLLDGWLARRTNRYTVFGSIADPAADKALVTTMVISLAVSGMLPLSIAAIIIGRDVALVISAFIIRYRTLEPPKTFTRYFNPRLPSASVTPTQISKYNTFLQLLLLGCLTLYPILFPDQGSPGLMLTEAKEEASSPYGDTIARAKTWIDPSITALMWITAATTIWSGVGYLGGAGSAKVLAARAQTVSQKVKSSLNKPPPPSS